MTIEEKLDLANKVLSAQHASNVKNIVIDFHGNSGHEFHSSAKNMRIMLAHPCSYLVESFSEVRLNLVFNEKTCGIEGSLFYNILDIDFDDDITIENLETGFPKENTTVTFHVVGADGKVDYVTMYIDFE